MIRFLGISIFLFSSFALSAQLASYIPQNQMLAWYAFNGNVFDNSGNGHNGATYNIVTTTDRFNMPLRALLFSEQGTEYLNYGDQNDFENESQFTLSLWIYPLSYGQTNDEGKRPLISKWSPGASPASSSYFLYFDNNFLNMQWSDGMSSASLSAPVSGIPLQAWTHITCTFSSGNCGIYLNGALVKDSLLPTAFIHNSPEDFVVGDWMHFENPAYSTFHGKLDDLGIWNRALHPCEIEALYTGVDCPSAGLVEMQEGLQQPVEVYNLQGQKVNDQPGTLLIYRYADGTTRKVWRRE